MFSQTLQKCWLNALCNSFWFRISQSFHFRSHLTMFKERQGICIARNENSVRRASEWNSGNFPESRQRNKSIQIKQNNNESFPHLTWFTASGKFWVSKQKAPCLKYLAPFLPKIGSASLVAFGSLALPSG